MKIINSKNIKKVDKTTIKEQSITSAELMERAAQECALNILAHQLYNADNEYYIFAGPGNNGGDGIAISRFLTLNYKCKTTVYYVGDINKMSEDTKIQYKKHIANKDLSEIINIKNEEDLKKINFNNPDCIIIDALFGIGLNRPLSGIYKEIINIINDNDFETFSIDIPSGLLSEYTSETNISEYTAVNADVVLSMQLPKLCFLLPENNKHIKYWEIINIGLSQNEIANTETNFYFIENKDIYKLLKTRKEFSHKGTYGHALIIAGKCGMMGASILATKACLRSGCGLVTSHVPYNCVNIMQISVPESILQIDRSEIIFTDYIDTNKFNAIGVGPGLGTKPNTVKALEHLLENTNNQNLVIDADAINIISENKYLMDKLPVNSILTPHPKELDRLIGPFKNNMDMIEKSIHICKKHKIIIVLKGRYTAVINNKGEVFFNSSGNNGMATGGSGDVLTGIITGLLAQKYSSIDAAKIGVYIHGLAGDMGLENESMESLIASDIIKNIGNAFKKCRNSIND